MASRDVFDGQPFNQDSWDESPQKRWDWRQGTCVNNKELFTWVSRWTLRWTHESVHTWMTTDGQSIDIWQQVEHTEESHDVLSGRDKTEPGDKGEPLRTILATCYISSRDDRAPWCSDQKKPVQSHSRAELMDIQI